MDHYISNDTYRALVEALLKPEPCPFTGDVETDQIKLILGEVGGVWPERIRPADEMVAA